MQILTTKKLFDAATLTGSYVASSAVKIGKANQVTLDVAYTMGTAETLNSIEIKVEFANPVLLNEPVTTDWHQEAAESVSGGTSTVSLFERTFTATQAAGTYDRFQIAIPVSSKFFRVSVKETGIAANGGTVTVKAIINENVDN